MFLNNFLNHHPLDLSTFRQETAESFSPSEAPMSSYIEIDLLSSDTDEEIMQINHPSTEENSKSTTCHDALLKEVSFITAGAETSVNRNPCHNPVKQSRSQKTQGKTSNLPDTPMASQTEIDLVLIDSDQEIIENTVIPAAEENTKFKSPRGGILKKLRYLALTGGMAINSSPSLHPVSPSTSLQEPVKSSIPSKVQKVPHTEVDDKATGIAVKVMEYTRPPKDGSIQCQDLYDTILYKLRYCSVKARMSINSSPNHHPVSPSISPQVQVVTSYPLKPTTTEHTEINKSSGSSNELIQNIRPSTDQSPKFKSPKGAILKKLNYRTLHWKMSSNGSPCKHQGRPSTSFQAQLVTLSPSKASMAPQIEIHESNHTAGEIMESTFTDENSNLKSLQGAILKNLRNSTMESKISISSSPSLHPISPSGSLHAEVENSHPLKETTAQYIEIYTSEEIMEKIRPSTDQNPKFKSPQGAILKKLNYRNLTAGMSLMSSPTLQPVNLSTF